MTGLQFLPLAYDPEGVGAIGTVGSSNGEHNIQAQPAVAGVAGNEQRERDAHRVAASWNATLTLSTEALEAGVVDKLVEAASVAVEELDCIAEFAMRQTEWTGDDDAALLAVKNLRTALALARGERA